MSDYYYIHALNLQCRRTGRTTLPSDIYIVPCGGTKLVGHLASLFLGENVRPLVLLDGDAAGRVRRTALMKELYAGHETGIIMLDEVLGRPGDEVEIEDIIGEAIILPAVNAIIGKRLTLTEEDRKAGSVPSQIDAAAAREGIELPDGWKALIAAELVSSWAEQKTELPASVIDAAARLFSVIGERFSAGLIATASSRSQS
jgi:hypothetical protein